MTNQQIIIDNKKRTVSSAKIKSTAPDVFAIRTHLFGQFDDIGFKKDHFIFPDDKHCLRTKLLLHGNDTRIDHLEFKIVEKLTIGNWYTQYSAGYWQLIDLKPKIAFDNYTGEEISWKKGDLIGYWAIMRKAFTPKMKKQIRVEFTDAASLKSVSDETKTQIQAELNNDPDFLSRLNNSCEVSDMMVTNAWLSLTKEEKERLLIGIGLLPDRFTKEQLLSATLLPDHCFVKPPANYLLNLFSYASKRQEIKNLIREMKKTNPNVESNIFNSVHSVNLDTVIGYKKDGMEHSFLDDYKTADCKEQQTEEQT